MEKIKVKGTEIEILSKGNTEYISLTSIAKYKDDRFPADIIKNWLRSKSTIEFLGLWERINNPNFKLVEFDQFKYNSGTNYFVLSPKKWITTVNAIGLISKSGRYGGTYTHKDIAFEFASWISPEFKLYLIKEFERLKEEENTRLSLDWNLSRILSKINYRIHTDSIKDKLIPKNLTKKQILLTYATEADILNMALFNTTAKQWRNDNKSKKGNIRDYADIRQLICLSNLESINAELIRDGFKQKDRLKKLNSIAIYQMASLTQEDSKLLGLDRLS
jgi:hypothetical protein